MNDINFQLIALAAIVSIASPGPATLAIMGMSMNQGRRYGLVLALGILTGSLFWSASAAFGLGAMMHANVWVLEVIRYAGAVYLLYLSYRSIRSAMASASNEPAATFVADYRVAYMRGLLIHLTNPKAILFFGALYSLALPAGIEPSGLLSVIFFVGVISAGIFLGYACLFSSAAIRRCYVQSKRLFETAFAILFGFAGIKILFSRLGTNS